MTVTGNVGENQGVKDTLDSLVQRADLDGLVRHVDDTCAAREWDHLLAVRDAARRAVDTGRQLWPIATLANQRLALWAPAPLAARAFDDAARTFMPGPVSEIVAVHHTWRDMSPHLVDGHDRALVAHERALRGDEIDGDEPEMLDVPFAIQSWEPRYEVAVYTDDGVDSPAPVIDVEWEWIACEPAATIADDPTADAFRRMMEPWTAQSNGSARCAVVEGDETDALGALGFDRVLLSPITPQDALARLAWAAASGGAHGRRRGAATGRSEAWWLLAVFAGLDDEWPCDPAGLGEVVESCEWFAFENDEAPTGGWGLHLVVVDPEEGLAAAFDATDRA